MSYSIGQLTDNVFAVAIWDDELATLDNCYVIKTPEHTTLIDCGKTAHSFILVKALTQIDVLPSHVSHIVTTHGHRDHVGGAPIFLNAVRYVPEVDRHYLADELQSLYTNLPASVSNIDLDILPLGHHTKGHVGYYHPGSRSLFCGDFLTFYGERVSPTGLVTSDEAIRQKTIATVKRWLQSPAVSARYNTDAYRQSLKALASLDVEHFCTGHGPVLKGTLAPFLQSLAEL